MQREKKRFESIQLQGKLSNLIFAPPSLFAPLNDFFFFLKKGNLIFALLMKKLGYIGL
jgi:hypothetical protein